MVHEPGDARQQITALSFSGESMVGTVYDLFSFSLALEAYEGVPRVVIEA